MKRIYVIAIAIFLVFVSGTIFIWSSSSFGFGSNGDVPQQKEYSIVLSEEGFSPEQTTIYEGDTVVFTTIQGKPFWPASDLHPTHGAYSEFDPKEPINAQQTWSFSFDRAGHWGYHDHLAPLHKGKITVLAKGTRQVQDLLKNSEESCNSLSKDSQAQCWQNEVETALKEKGIEAAFDVVEMIYRIQPDCHGYAHRIGEEAYKLFAQGKPIQLTPKTYYCGYGFYHSFMEALLQTTGDFEEARKFCAYADQQLSSQIKGAESACYHGIGHGMVDGGDPRTWGDAQAMIEPGLKICGQVGATEFLRSRCATGAFNAIEILSLDPKYKLSKISEDPFFLCRTQPERYREGCYTNMLPGLLRLTKNDFLEAAKVVENTIENDENYAIRNEVLSALFHEPLRVYGEFIDYQRVILLCRSLKEQSRLPCIEGLAGGHIKYGEPQREYLRGIEFCDSKLLLENEKMICFQYILSRLRLWYSQEKSQEICAMVEEKYRAFCAST